MGFLKRLFGLDKSKEEPIINSDISKLIIAQPQREFIDAKCEICQQVIGQERKKKLAGKLYHRKCFREQYNKLKQQGRIF